MPLPVCRVEPSSRYGDAITSRVLRQGRRFRTDSQPEATEESGCLTFSETDLRSEQLLLHCVAERLVAQLHAHRIGRLGIGTGPGSIRELQNVLERAEVLTPGSVVDVPDVQPAQPLGASAARRAALTLVENERVHVKRVLELAGGRIDGPHGAARILGLKAGTLQSRMEKLGLL